MNRFSSALELVGLALVFVALLGIDWRLAVGVLGAALVAVGYTTGDEP